MKIITWMDLEGRYRVTSPAYNDRMNVDLDEDEMFALVVAKLLIEYNLRPDHEFHLVEHEEQKTRLQELSAQWFRYAPIADANGRHGVGAGEMDEDGKPKINMVKARDVQMNWIRKARNVKLAELDVEQLKVFTSSADVAIIEADKQVLRDLPSTFDLSGATTPVELRALWPTGLVIQ